MEVIEVILSSLGVGVAGVYLIWAVFAAFNLLWAILSAVLATRRGRNAWNWFFLTCIYGVFGLLFLACSKTLNEKERDTLAKVLWWLFAIPVVILTTLLIVFAIEKNKDEKLTKKVLQDTKTEHIYEYKEQTYDVSDSSATFSSGIEKNQNRRKYKPIRTTEELQKAIDELTD